MSVGMMASYDQEVEVVVCGCMRMHGVGVYRLYVLLLSEHIEHTDIPTPLSSQRGRGARAAEGRRHHALAGICVCVCICVYVLVYVCMCVYLCVGKLFIFE